MSFKRTSRPGHFKSSEAFSATLVNLQAAATKSVYDDLKMLFVIKAIFEATSIIPW